MKIYRITGKIATEITKAMNRGKKMDSRIKCWQLPDIVTRKMTLLIGYCDSYEELNELLKQYIFRHCNCPKEKLVLELVEEKK